MKIDIICRVRYEQLYERMVSSCSNTTKLNTGLLREKDDGSPRISETYNRLGSTSTADILLFVHDDMTFLSNDWDKKLVEGFEKGFDVLGVVGSKEYLGGMVFDAGYEYSAGKIVGKYDDIRMVKIMRHGEPIEPVKVLDGVFLATTREHFKANKFDEKLDGLFYYDMDYCLRANCAVVDILIAHEKPKELYGQYPEGMKKSEDYDAYFKNKHNLIDDYEIGDQRCATIPLSEYVVNL